MKNQNLLTRLSSAVLNRYLHMPIVVISIFLSLDVHAGNTFQRARQCFQPQQEDAPLQQRAVEGEGQLPVMQDHEVNEGEELPTFELDNAADVASEEYYPDSGEEKCEENQINSSSDNPQGIGSSLVEEYNQIDSHGVPADAGQIGSSLVEEQNQRVPVEDSQWDSSGQLYYVVEAHNHVNRNTQIQSCTVYYLVNPNPDLRYATNQSHSRETFCVTAYNVQNRPERPINADLTTVYLLQNESPQAMLDLLARIKLAIQEKVKQISILTQNERPRDLPSYHTFAIIIKDNNGNLLDIVILHGRQKKYTQRQPQPRDGQLFALREPIERARVAWSIGTVRRSRTPEDGPLLLQTVGEENTGQELGAMLVDKLWKLLKEEHQANKPSPLHGFFDESGSVDNDWWILFIRAVLLISAEINSPKDANDNQPYPQLLDNQPNITHNRRLIHSKEVLHFYREILDSSNNDAQFKVDWQKVEALNSQNSWEIVNQLRQLIVENYAELSSVDPSRLFPNNDYKIHFISNISTDKTGQSILQIIDKMPINNRAYIIITGQGSDLRWKLLRIKKENRLSPIYYLDPSHPQKYEWDKAPADLALLEQYFLFNGEYAYESYHHDPAELFKKSNLSFLTDPEIRLTRMEQALLIFLIIWNETQPVVNLQIEITYELLQRLAERLSLILDSE